MRFFGQGQCGRTGENTLRICTESREQQRMRMLLQNPALQNNRKVVVGFVYNKVKRKKKKKI